MLVLTQVLFDLSQSRKVTIHSMSWTQIEREFTAQPKTPEEIIFVHRDVPRIEAMSSSEVISFKRKSTAPYVRIDISALIR